MSLYRLLSALLCYPEPELLDALGEVETALSDHPDAEEALQPLIGYLATNDLIALQENYVATFDRNRSHSLHLFEHVHGDSRDRGPAMIDLIRTYEQAGLLLREDELPDHLSVLLEYASTQPPAQARELLAETAHILRALFSALLKKGSPYASVLAAALELAGERAEPVAVPEDEPLDQTWEEPPVFDGCSTAGQARPGAEQAVRFVRSASQGVQP